MRVCGVRGEQVYGAELRGANYRWDREYIGVRAIKKDLVTGRLPVNTRISSG
jgi:hypothetical protein